MAPKTTKRKSNKPTLIACGNHFINPLDISRITKVVKGNKTLYVVKFYSDPNPDFACWIRGSEIDSLLDQFNIIVSDEREE